MRLASILTSKKALKGHGESKEKAIVDRYIEWCNPFSGIGAVRSQGLVQSILRDWCNPFSGIGGIRSQGLVQSILRDWWNSFLGIGGIHSQGLVEFVLRDWWNPFSGIGGIRFLGLQLHSESTNCVN